MNFPAFSTSLHRFGPSCLFTVIMLFLTALQPAQAQWTKAEADTAMNSYNNAFYFSESGSNDAFRVDQGSTTPAYFWNQAIEDDMVYDAYLQSGSSTYKNMLPTLVNGFAYHNGYWWNGADQFDDDMMMAEIFWIHAYQAVGTSIWLTQAETALQNVYARGKAPDGGIYWNAQGCPSACTNNWENSSANWSFIIAADLLYRITGNTTYLNEATGVFNFAKANLYIASTGAVIDGVGKGTYNYDTYVQGMAIAAFRLMGDGTDETLAAQYLKNDFPDYAGTYNGYNILPDDLDMSENGASGGGFNGMALRWVAYAWVNGGITDSSVLPWMQANVEKAYSVMNASNGLSWNNWEEATPSSGLYSWDCYDTVTGMLDVPIP